MNRQILLDTETTGLDPKSGHRVIEIGCVEIVNRKFTGSEFHTYLNPEREIDEEAEKIHGLSFEFLSDNLYSIINVSHVFCDLYESPCSNRLVHSPILYRDVL